MTCCLKTVSSILPYANSRIHSFIHAGGVRGGSQTRPRTLRGIASRLHALTCGGKAPRQSTSQLAGADETHAHGGWLPSPSGRRRNPVGAVQVTPQAEGLGVRSRVRGVPDSFRDPDSRGSAQGGTPGTLSRTQEALAAGPVVGHVAQEANPRLGAPRDQSAARISGRANPRSFWGRVPALSAPRLAL